MGLFRSELSLAEWRILAREQELNGTEGTPTMRDAFRTEAQVQRIIMSKEGSDEQDAL